MARIELADRVEVFTIVVPASTTSASPYSQDLEMRAGELVGVELVIPDGHLGLTGIQLAIDGQAVIPATRGAYIVGNDDVIEWPLGGFPTGGQWQAVAYNTDVFAHTFYVRLLLTELELAASRPRRLVEPVQL